MKKFMQCLGFSLGFGSLVMICAGIWGGDINLQHLADVWLPLAK